MDPEGLPLSAAVQELWAIGRRLDELSARKAFLMAAAATREQKLSALAEAGAGPRAARHPAALATRGSAAALEQPTTAQIYAGQPPLLYLQDRESQTGAARMAPLDPGLLGGRDALTGDESAGLVGFEPAYPTNIAGIGGVLGPRAGVPSRFRPVRNPFRMSDDLVKGLRALAATPGDAQSSFYFSRPIASPDDEHDDVTHLQAARNMGLLAAAPLLPLVSAPPAGPQKPLTRQRQFNVVSVSKVAEEAFELANIERLVADLNDGGLLRAAEGLSPAVHALRPRGLGGTSLRGTATSTAERETEREEHRRRGQRAAAAAQQRLAEAQRRRAGASPFEQTSRAVAEMMRGRSLPPGAPTTAAARHERVRRALARLLDTHVVCLRWRRPDRPPARPVDRTLDLLCRAQLHRLPDFAPSSLRLMNRGRRHGAAWEPVQDRFTPVTELAPGPGTPP